MSTGTEHYREAERLADIAYRSEPEFAGITAAVAQVHATLALAAATAMSHWNSYELPMPQPDRLAWERVASERPAALQRQREAGRAEAAEFASYDEPADDDGHRSFP